MYQSTQDPFDGWIKIEENFDPTIKILPQESHTINIDELNNVEKLTRLSYVSLHESITKKLKWEYRFSRDNVSFSPWIELVDGVFVDFPLLNPKNLLYLQIKLTRFGSNEEGEIELVSYLIDGYVDKTSVNSTDPITLNVSNNTSVIKPPYIYKVFKLDDIEILSTGDFENLDITYRFSQDYRRSYTDWEPFNLENITTVRINPIRFFQIEYKLEYSGTSSVVVYDINLIGDFQNVSSDYQKTNLFGVRENCNCLKLSIVNSENETTSGEGGPQGSNQIGVGLNSSCDPNQSPLYGLSIEERANLFNPYAQSQAVSLLNKLSNDANAIFGHEVVYFITDPDKKGIDFTFHEYQLYNYICDSLIKISVEQNQFPDNQIAFNQFDLALFESFEVHIPKDEFKNGFGPEKRPAKEDFLWFCELNRMYQVEHAQPFRNFNNNAVYYKVMLKKYSQKANVQAANETISEKIRKLTKNSTIDELFGVELENDKSSIANKEQTRVLTKDKLRVDINVKINKELIENSANVISKNNYELSHIPYGGDAVIYRNMKNEFLQGDNISFMCWFNINNYVVNDYYNFFKYYDDDNKIGFEFGLEADIIHFKFNEENYELPLGVTGSNTAEGINEETWYAYLVNLDQRKREVSQYLYKRNVEKERDAGNLNTTILKLVYSSSEDITPREFVIENIHAKIISSDMKITNLRLFSDVVPLSDQSKLLNMAIIGDDSRNLIFADNANTKLVLPNNPMGLEAGT